MASLEEIEYGGWSHCYRLTNGIVEVVIPAEIGIRLMRFGFVGEANAFCEFEEHLGKTTGDEWRIYGGHRLWHAPEHPERTYQPDNNPVAIDTHGGVIVITQSVEWATGIQKQIELQMAEDTAQITVTHRLINRGLWNIETAPWGLSAMQPGGTAVLPLPQRGTHPEALLPNSTLTLWAYTDLSDERWTLGSKYILLRQDPTRSAPQKIGASVTEGWAAYVNDGLLFVKQFAPHIVGGVAYPDLNSSVETFTNDVFLELESLGAVRQIEPSQAAEHTEVWSLYRDVPTPQSDADVDRDVLPNITQR